MEPGFMILNKLSNDNIWEAIKPEMEFRRQTPFILYGKQSGININDMTRGGRVEAGVFGGEA